MNTEPVMVSTGVSVTGGCAIDYQLRGDQIEFLFGGDDTFELLINETGLANLVRTATEALSVLRDELGEQ